MGGLPRSCQPSERDRGVSRASAAATTRGGEARAQRLPSAAVQLHTARRLAPVQEWPRPAATPTRWAQLASLQLVRQTSAPTTAPARRRTASLPSRPRRRLGRPPCAAVTSPSHRRHVAISSQRLAVSLAPVHSSLAPLHRYNHRSVILADEMGLGKTAQAIALLDHIWRRESIRGPFLIVAPLSTLAHWQREIEEWTDLSVLNYYGRAESRDVMHQYEWHFEGPPSMHVLTTTRALPTGTSGTLKDSPHSRRLLRRR